jgi:uncharacterized protein (DUF58 family)
MTTPASLARQLAEIQDELIRLPTDAFGRRWELRVRQDDLRCTARKLSYALFEDLFDEDLLEQLHALRQEMRRIEKRRIDLVSQSGSSGAGMGDMHSLNAATMNMAMDEAAGLPAIKKRIGLIKGALIDRGVHIPEAA